MRALSSGVFKRQMLLGSVAAIAVMHGASAAAQTSPAPRDVEEVVVTASRAASTGFASPTPTTVVSGQTIQQQASTSVMESLNQIPAFKATQNASSNAVRTQNPGAATADLRGLGSQRTLVLVNGARLVPSAPVSSLNGSVSPDMNQVPTLMVERMEVVTGGASAQWGSDAVAGVVNIILKNHYEGFEVTAQAGSSERADNESFRIGLLGGLNFAGGRGHLVGGVDYENKQKASGIYSRGWGREEWMIVANSSTTNGLPAQVLAPNVHTALAPGGLIVGPTNFSLRGQTFNPDGTTRPFEYGSLTNATVMVGGEGLSLLRYASLSPEVRRISPYLRAEYQLTDDVTAALELSYSDTWGAFYGSIARNNNLVIRDDNPYLPSAVRAAMNTARISSFRLSRINYDMPAFHNKVKNETPRAALSLDGKFRNGWSWDAHATASRNTYTQIASGNPIQRNFAFAADAVTSGGQIVCRATLPGASFDAEAAGCVPINLFGEGNASAAAVGYVYGEAYNKSLYEQQTAAFNIKGLAGSTWAGPIAFGAGVEYRHEKQRVAPDALAQAGLYNAGNGTAFTGAFNVKEGFVEVSVPLAQDQPIIRSLAVDGTVRVADYSTVGMQTTWKLGLNYEPNDWLRLRLTRSRDIRAPALFELYSQGANAPTPLTVRGITATIPANVSLGNPDLGPERGDTTTIGAVVAPKGRLSGLRVSLDYYDIKLNNAILNLQLNTVAQFCNIGVQSFCDFFTFDPVTGGPTSLVAPAQNAASFQTTGYDLAVGYRNSLSDWFASVPGELETALSATYVQHAYLDQGAGRIDRAEENSAINTGAMPRLRATLSETYTVGPLSLTALLQYTSAGNIDNVNNTSPATTININRIPSRTYLNLYGSYRFGAGDRTRVFASVFNLFDKDPPVAPLLSANQATNGQYYDKIGRSYRIGFSHAF